MSEGRELPPARPSARMADLSDMTTQEKEFMQAMNDAEIDIDNLLKQYERACAAVVEQGDSNLSATTKERAIYRNEIRARLIAAAGLPDDAAHRAHTRIELRRANAVGRVPGLSREGRRSV